MAIMCMLMAKKDTFVPQPVLKHKRKQPTNQWHLKIMFARLHVKTAIMCTPMAKKDMFAPMLAKRCKCFVLLNTENSNLATDLLVWVVCANLLGGVYAVYHIVASTKDFLFSK
jgi:hypothetical protein